MAEENKNNNKTPIPNTEKKRLEKKFWTYVILIKIIVFTVCLIIFSYFFTRLYK